MLAGVTGAGEPSGLERVAAAAVAALAGAYEGAQALVWRVDDDVPPALARVIRTAIESGGTARDETAAAAAIVVGGQPFGALAVHAPVPLPLGAAELAAALATALAAAAEHDALIASRERILAVNDAARRSFERDLHDGAQQRVIALALELRLAEAELPPSSRIEHAIERADQLLAQLRELSRALYPAILSEGGLRPALRALARQSAVPVRLAAEVDERLGEAVELAAYHVVAEALENAGRHAGAGTVAIRAQRRDGRLCIAVADDGRGGADPARGNGLTSLRDRVEALGGALRIASPAGGGTAITAELPPYPP
jgi:signal transduction histidine kinase